MYVMKCLRMLVGTSRTHGTNYISVHDESQYTVQAETKMKLHLDANQVQRRQILSFRSCKVLLVALSCSCLGSIPVADSFAVRTPIPIGLEKHYRGNADNVQIRCRSSSISTTGDEAYYSPSFVPYGERSLQQQQQKVTLTRFLSHEVQEKPELREMVNLLLAVQLACKSISNLVTRVPSPPIKTSSTTNSAATTSAATSAEYRSMKRLDELSTIVLRNALRFTGKFRMVKAANDDALRRQSHDQSINEEYQPGVLIASALDSNYVAIFDPLDGSNNADAAICTGTLFGVFKTTTATTIPMSGHTQSQSVNEQEDSLPSGQREEELIQCILQPGRNLKAAGYCMYSSATILVFTIGRGVHMFTLDPQINEFVLTNPNVRIPQRGSIYSCNESNSEGWNNGMKSYISTLKRGRGESGVKYTGRYVGSMVGDIHRTLTYGGIFAYPRDEFYHPNGNIQLLYKSAPLAFVISQAGGKSSTGEGQDVLDVTPHDIHERKPCFLGSPDDIDEMKKYMNQ